MSKEQIWTLLAAEFREYPDDFGGPVQDYKSIQNLESALNLRFSATYVDFIKKYGSGLFQGHILYGIKPLESMGKVATNVVEKTQFYREQDWPGIENWYIVSDDGSGNPIGVDPDGKVWLSDHDAGFEQIKLADSFEEFLYKLYTDTLYE